MAESNWRNVATALKAGAMAILPVGAASKQHGLHLPMNTDYLQAEWFARRLKDAALVAVWPTLSYGHYPAFVDYPGSCSLSLQLFPNLCTEIIDEILRAAARGLIVLNTGISTIDPIRMAIAQCGAPARVRLANVYEGVNYRAAQTRIEQQSHGGHADEMETSIMLAIAPKTVRMDLARACTHEMVPGPLNRSRPNDPNYSPDGVYGDPRLASKEKGKVLVDAMLNDLLTLIEARPV